MMLSIFASLSSLFLLHFVFVSSTVNANPSVHNLLTPTRRQQQGKNIRRRIKERKDNVNARRNVEEEEGANIVKNERLNDICFASTSSYSFQPPTTTMTDMDLPQPEEETWIPFGPKLDTLWGKNHDGYHMALSSDGRVTAIGIETGIVSTYKISENTTEWIKVGQDLIFYNKTDNPNLKVRVSISSDGSVVAVGVSWNYGKSGFVEVFSYDSKDKMDWVQMGGTFGKSEEERFGKSVSLSGDGKTLAAFKDGSREIFVYKYNGVEWEQIGEAIGADTWDTELHERVSMSSDGQVVAFSESEYPARVKAYSLTSQNGKMVWTQLGNTIVGPDLWSDFFGRSVTLSSNGDILAVGSFDNDSWTVGYAKIYHLNENATWTQLGNKISAKQSCDNFGEEKIALSSNGCTLATGAKYTDVKTGYHGEVRVFTFDGNDWVQRGQHINGKRGDHYGNSVALSGDGTIVAGIAEIGYFQAYQV